MVKVNILVMMAITGILMSIRADDKLIINDDNRFLVKECYNGQGCNEYQYLNIEECICTFIHEDAIEKFDDATHEEQNKWFLESKWKIDMLMDRVEETGSLVFMGYTFYPDVKTMIEEHFFPGKKMCTGIEVQGENLYRWKDEKVLLAGGGTGCLIGERLVLTAAHVLKDFDPLRYACVFDFIGDYSDKNLIDDENKNMIFDKHSIYYIVGYEILLQKDKLDDVGVDPTEVDVMVLKLNRCVLDKYNNKRKCLRVFEHKNLSDNIRNRKVLTYGHPYFMPMVFASNGQTMLRLNKLGTPYIQSFVTDLDMSNACSGSPIIMGDSKHEAYGQIVGVHLGNEPKTDFNSDFIISNESCVKERTITWKEGEKPLEVRKVEQGLYGISMLNIVNQTVGSSCPEWEQTKKKTTIKNDYRKPDRPMYFRLPIPPHVIAYAITKVDEPRPSWADVTAVMEGQTTINVYNEPCIVYWYGLSGLDMGEEKVKGR